MVSYEVDVCSYDAKTLFLQWMRSSGLWNSCKIFVVFTNKQRSCNPLSWEYGKENSWKNNAKLITKRLPSQTKFRQFKFANNHKLSNFTPRWCFFSSTNSFLAPQGILLYTLMIITSGAVVCSSNYNGNPFSFLIQYRHGNSLTLQ